MGLEPIAVLDSNSSECVFMHQLRYMGLSPNPFSKNYSQIQHLWLQVWQISCWLCHTQSGRGVLGDTLRAQLLQLCRCHGEVILTSSLLSCEPARNLGDQDVSSCLRCVFCFYVPYQIILVLYMYFVFCCCSTSQFFPKRSIISSCLNILQTSISTLQSLVNNSEKSIVVHKGKQALKRYTSSLYNILLQ